MWKPIKDYEGVYVVSDNGEIASLDRKDSMGRDIKGHIIKPSIRGCGYLYVTLWKNGQPKNRTVHSLVAEAFIGERPKGYEVNHKDENKNNNNVNNLEYVTRVENLIYNGRAKRVGENFKIPIKATNVITGEVFLYPSTTDAAKDEHISGRGSFTTKRTHIKNAIHGFGGCKTAYGYKWEQV